MAKTAEAFHLPTQTVVYGAEVNGEKTTFPAGIIWDVDGCDYDPQNKEAQKFTVTGHLDLEDGENNAEMEYHPADPGTGRCLSGAEQTGL